MPFQKKNLRNSLKKKQMKASFSKENISKQFQNAFKKMGDFFSSLSFRSLHEKKKKEKKRRWLLASIVLLIAIFSVAIFSSKVQIFLKDIGIKTVAAVFGADIPKDDHGLTNVLIMGIGGAGHEGDNLTDTLMLASIDEKDKSVSMLSLPRDLYVDYEIDGGKYHGRINEVFREGLIYWKTKITDVDTQRKYAEKELEKVVEKVTGYRVQRYAMIDFRGFEKVVDELGGITVTVEKDIYDSTYPGPNWSYITFEIKKGVHFLDGATALKYARSRHNTSDFDRSKRQKIVLNAIREKALTTGVLTSPEKIRSLLQIFDDHFWSDISLSEMISLASFAKDVPSDQIFPFGLTDDPENGSGGFLVTPDRDLYGGASVLVPFLNMETQIYSQIQFFSEIIFEHRSVLRPEAKIDVYNTTKKTGLATLVGSHLMRYGFQIGEVENTDPLREYTTVEYFDTPLQQEMVSLLKRKIEARFVELPAPSEGFSPESVKIYIGKDFSDNAYRGSLYRRPLSEMSTEILPLSSPL